MAAKAKAEFEHLQHLQTREQQLKEELSRVQQELIELTPKIKSDNQKVEEAQAAQLQQHTQATILDPELEQTAGRMIVLEKQVVNYKRGILTAGRDWDRLVATWP